MHRNWTLALLGAASLFGSTDKTLPLEKTSNDVVEISVSLLTKDEIVKEIGSDLGRGILIMRVSIRPMSKEPVEIDYDDFRVLDRKTGGLSGPYNPTEFAALVVSPNKDLWDSPSAPDTKPSPLLNVLREKGLPMMKVTQTISGLLYYTVRDNIKPKDLEMTYETANGSLRMRFKP